MSPQDQIELEAQKHKRAPKRLFQILGVSALVSTVLLIDKNYQSDLHLAVVL